MAVHPIRIPDIVGAVGAATEAVGAAQAVPTSAVSDEDLAVVTEQLASLEARVSALRHELLLVADERELAAKEAAAGTDAWAARLTGDTRELLAGGLHTARLLREKYAVTRGAFASGRINLQQAKVIVNAAEQAPPEASPAQVAAAEAWLVTKATGDGNRHGRPMDVRQLRRSARRMFDVVDRGLADAHEQILLGRRERTAERETFLALHDNGDGTFSGRFTIPELHGNLFRHALQRLSAPRRLGRSKATGATEVDESVQDLNVYEAHGLALLELLEHLPTDGHAANGVTLIVKVGLDQLRTDLGAAGLETGADITAGEARRLACNAGIVPAVLDGASRPLDLGRTRRLFGPAQRQALSLVHDSCAIETCQRPFAWTEAHHSLEAWATGGRTDLANALPLCGYHHRRAHDEAFRLERGHGGWRLRPRR
ncbi:DUF222 domain-containing protein [Nocardioides sp. MAHUQ-72]|uniref:HNH endonuclease signature motif containing protein n=1 Tax=unclassified Nocardioides TaxID=2615069 RepID=UPI00360FCA01